ncbi:MAG: glycosyltransferase family 39 protein [Ardenticatenaceae bacterium]|nr:glycosyltransferase family 39 protein [Ardenticatenaceae bacterium]
MNKHEEQTSTRRLLAGLAVFLWLGLLAGGYFWAHKPFDVEVVTAVAQTALNILVWLGLIWLSTSLGLIVLSSLRVADDDWAGHLGLAAGVGLGLLAILTSFLGFAGLFNAAAAWLLVFALAIVTAPRWRELKRLMGSLQLPRPQTNLQKIILGYAVASLSLTFIMTLTPVIAWDSLTYHLVGPKLYIEAGHFVHSLNIPHLGFPLLGQMQFTLGMLLVGDGVPALFHFGYGLLTLILTVALARRAFGVDAAWWAVLVLLSVPTLFTLMSWPYVDVTLLFYTTAAFYAFYCWLQDRRMGWLVVMGMMIGFSGGLKYTAVATPLAIVICLVWVSRRDGLSVIVKRLVIVGGVALVLVLPWLAKNYLTTGNPVYPFFLNSSLYWDAWRAWWYDRPGTGLASTAPWRLFIVPLEATILGTEGSDFYEATIGPFILGSLFLLPLVWGKFSRREKFLVACMLLLMGVNYLLWLNGVARTALLLRARFLFLIFGVTAVLDGLILSSVHRLKHPALAVDWLVAVISTFTLVLLLVTQVLTFWQLNPVPVVVGLESKAHYLQRTLGTYEEAITAVNQLPSQSHVQFLWEARSYYCQVFCQPDPILDTWLHLTQGQGYDAAQIAQAWQAAGVTHVLMHDAGLNFVLQAKFDPVTEADLAVWEEFSKNYLQPIQIWPDEYTLYQFTP